MVSKFGLFVCGLAFAINFSSCTYAPRNTKIDQTYNARQMAVGVSQTEGGGITSTTSEDDGITSSNNTVGDSTKSQQDNWNAIKSTDKISNHSQVIKALNYVTIGSTRGDVARIHGTPEKIMNYETLEQEWWYYGYSTIVFKRGLVYEWNDADGNLKIKI